MMDKIYLFIENIILKVGFEIHVQLNTLNKLFSKETYNLNKKSNSLTGEYTLGLPGSLPVFNVNALIKSLYAVKLFNCKCSSIVGFDRKNYFYSDLVKGYQITQKYKPIGLFGYIEFFSMYRNVLKKITIRDIHIEEDVGVISNYFLFNNFNRSGVSLLEFVTEPIQFEGYFNPNELNLFLRCLFNQLKYLNISNCELQSGNVRLDVNISATLRNFNQVLNIIEVKNLNSIDSAFKCIFFELRRQIFLTRKNIPKLEYHTRNWNLIWEKTCFLRNKDNKYSYKFTREPDFNLNLNYTFKFNKKKLKYNYTSVYLKYYYFKNQQLLEYFSRTFYTLVIICNWFFLDFLWASFLYVFKFSEKIIYFSINEIFLLAKFLVLNRIHNGNKWQFNSRRDYNLFLYKKYKCKESTKDFFFQKNKLKIFLFKNKILLSGNNILLFLKNNYYLNLTKAIW